VALAPALVQDDDTSWHKFRIAVKEVRYTAERELPGTAAESRVAEVVEICKSFQSLLGGWHDCVVQAQLLEELPPSPLVGELQKFIAERRQQRLAEIRAAAAGQELFRPGGRLLPRPGRCRRPA
jgi:CHAD domain-containing protein